MLKDWFLIADEVGLGKTISAKAIIFERMKMKKDMIKGKNGIHCMYIASNVDLANQNMKEFVCKTKDWLGDLAGFQRENVKKAMQKMFDSNWELTSSTSELELELKELDIQGKGIRNTEFRLSRFTPDMCKSGGSFIMQLSPKTSFAAQTTDGDSGYRGSDEERESLKKDFENINDGSLLSQELKIAMEYECEGISTASVNKKSVEKFVNNHFHAARRIRSNAAVGLYKPDIIILDEFQRYRDILTRENGYTIERMLKYLKYAKERKLKDSKDKERKLKDLEEEYEYTPKILLLSATPYRLDKDKVEIDWSYADKVKIDWGYADKVNEESNEEIDKESNGYAVSSKRKEEEGKNQGEEKKEGPFKDFKTLVKEMGKITDSNETAKYEDYMVRTERPQKQKKIFIEMQRDRCMEHQKYLNCLIKKCVDKDIKAEDIKKIGKCIYYTPSFWMFNSGYQVYGKVTGDAKKKLLETSEAEKKNVYDHLSLSTLIKEVFGKEDELPRLWVPPVCEGMPGKGKTLVFTSLTMTTRSVAYYCNKHANKLIEKYKEFDDEPLDNESFGDVINELLKGKEEIKKKIEKPIPFFTAFFNRKFVRRVIAANNKTRENWNCKNYKDAIIKYCDEFRFNDMISEWMHIDNKCKESINAIVKAPADIKIQSLSKNKKTVVTDYSPLDYAEMFESDDAKFGGDDVQKDIEDTEDAKTTKAVKHNVTKIDEIICRFNSPFYPMVLVARSAAQEGFNLQYYGDKIMHWQFAPTPEAFLQREGRLDRPGSLTMRHKIWECVHRMGKSPKDYQEAWEFVEKKEISLQLDKDGLIPKWHLELPLPANTKDEDKEKQMIEDREKYDIRQILAVYEYNDSLVHFAKGLQSALEYGEAFKQENRKTKEPENQ